MILKYSNPDIKGNRKPTELCT